MSEASGKWISDDRKRAETEIADLVPYVSGSAIDAVRDALRKIVLENQDHSEILDKLLPELQQMPSKRSQALDWLDVELARMSDDDIILLMGRLKSIGGHEVLLKRLKQPVSRPQFHRRWMMPAAIIVLAIGGYGTVRMWPIPVDVDALREELTRELRPAIEDELREEMQGTRDEISRLKKVNEWLREAYTTILDSRVEDPQGWLETFMRRTEETVEKQRRMSDETPPQNPQGDRPEEKP